MTAMRPPSSSRQRGISLQSRAVLLITSLIAIAVAATAVALTVQTRNALLDQTRQDGLIIAQLLARSASFAHHIPQEVEDAIGEQMLVEASIAAHLVAIAERAGLAQEEIVAHLQAITAGTALDEFWITDSQGRAYLRNRTDVDFVFSPDPIAQPQASEFWPLLTGDARAVVQQAREREIGDVYKYAGVGGVDKPRIVQVGYQAQFLENLRQQMGMSQLVTELVSGGNVKALRIVDGGLVTLAYSAVPGLSAEQAFDVVDRPALQAILRGGRPTSALSDEALTVIAPVTDSAGRIIGAALVSLPIGHVQSAIGRAILAALGAAGVVLAAGLAASVFLARRVTQPVEQLAAAAARIESGQYARLGLEGVCARRDEIGHLARLFERMAGQVYAREQQLSRQVAELRIEIDEARRAWQVEEITETEFFKDLRARADQLRQRGRPNP